MKNFKAFSNRVDRFSWGPDDVEHHVNESAVFATPARRAETFPRLITPHPEEVEHQKAHADSLTNEERKTVHSYKYDSTSFNHHLRNLRKNEGWRESNYGAMDRVTSLPSKHPMSLYRGFGPFFPIKNLHVGHEFTDHGYTGLTHDLETAAIRGTMTPSDDPEYHFLNRNENQHFTMAMIHMPAGTKGHYLDVNPDHHTFSVEKEHVLQRGTRFRVVGHSRAHQPIHGMPMSFDVVHLHVVGQHPKEL